MPALAATAEAWARTPEERGETTAAEGRRRWAVQRDGEARSQAGAPAASERGVQAQYAVFNAGAGSGRLMAIQRRPLREAVRAAVLERLDGGSLPVGANVNEPELAEELGVSRTPLREALLGLEHEGLLVGQPGRGWVVAPLTPQIVFEVYPIIWALETEALRSCDPEDLLALADELDELNAQLRRRDEPLERMRLDDRWHARLLSICPNRRMVQLIASQKRIVHRYEFAYMSAPDTVPASADQHAAIIAALRGRDLDAAARHLEQNWRHSVQAIAALLERRS